jgi:hypothetical protein
MLLLYFLDKKIGVKMASFLFCKIIKIVEIIALTPGFFGTRLTRIVGRIFPEEVFLGLVLGKAEVMEGTLGVDLMNQEPAVNFGQR